MEGKEEIPVLERVRIYGKEIDSREFMSFWGNHMGDKSWKRWEREVASWFGGKRNPLSGGNNYDDRGRKRYGDVVGVEGLVIECKLLKRVGSISRAKKTRSLARKLKKGFVHIEKEKRSNLVCFVVDKETAKKIAKFLREKR